MLTSKFMILYLLSESFVLVKFHLVPCHTFDPEVFSIRFDLLKLNYLYQQCFSCLHLIDVLVNLENLKWLCSII